MSKIVGKAVIHANCAYKATIRFLKVWHETSALTLIVTNFLSLITNGLPRQGISYFNANTGYQKTPTLLHAD